MAEDWMARIRPAADEAFAALHADEALRLRVLRAARTEQGVRRPVPRFVLAMAAAALLVLLITPALRQGKRPGDPLPTDAPQPVQTLQNLEAGGGAVVASTEGWGAAVRLSGASEELPMLSLPGAVYALQDGALSAEQVGEALGSVALWTETPSVALSSGESVSNLLPVGARIHALSGLPRTTAVAAELDGSWRLFRRVSYAGVFGARSLEECLAIRGQVAQIDWQGRGTLTGAAAEGALSRLLDTATLVAKEAEPGETAVDFILSSGVTLRWSADGDTLIGCGAWAAPEFAAAF